ncbi:MAG: FecR family protein [Spirosomataceae bacterium]
MNFSSNPFSVTDLLENEAFRKWMKEKHPEDRLFWEEWLEVHPDKREIYEQAVAAFLVIEGNVDKLSDVEVAQKTQEILELIPDESDAPLKPLLNWAWIGWAAAAVIVSVAAWYRFYLPEPHLSEAITTRSEEKTTDAATWMTVRNSTQQPMIVLLPDNSSVVLSTGSSLRFQKETDKNTRAVFLQGEGFFEVAKNPEKPFFVYTNNLTTKVLGTSFQVRAFTNESVALVKVKSGKVAVTSVASPDKLTFLTEHQQFRIATKTKEVTQEESATPPENPAAIINQQFTYEYTSVSEILDQLESAYHMPIQFEREKLKTCTFTGQLNDVPFLEKIRLICLTVESTYEVVDNQVIIHSKGCH